MAPDKKPKDGYYLNNTVFDLITAHAHISRAIP